MTHQQPPAEAPKRSAGRIILRNTLVGFSAQMVLRVANFLFQVLVIRILGDSQFGQYSIVLAWAGLFSVLGDLGVSQFYAREIARDRSFAALHFWDVVVIRFLLAILAALVTTIGAGWYGYEPEIVLAVGLFTTTYLLQALLAPMTAILTGNERVDITSSLDVIGQVVLLSASGLFLFAGLNFVWLVVASFINIPVVMILAFWFIRRNRLSPPPFKVNVRSWGSLLKGGLPFGFIQLSLSFAFRVDTIVLSRVVSNAEVGWYNAAYNLIFTLNSVVRPFSTAVVPTLAREHAANPDNVRPWYYQGTRMILFIGLPIAVGGMILSEQLILFLYDYPNIPAYLAFMILIWDLPTLMYASYCGNLTTVMRLERNAAVVYGTQGIVNLILNLILSTRFGMIGAAFSTVLTDFYSTALFYVLFRHKLGPGLKFNRLARIGLAAAAMGAAVFLLRDIHLIVAIGIGAVVYLALVWLIRAFSQEEQARLGRIVAGITARLRPG
ncbi:MAG: flippase [Anaerolineae bacterium]|nr:flippase [Anaerolineae bacterium]